MPAYIFNGTSINYITSIGIQKSRIVSMVQLNDKTYYQLENGDCVDDTPLGFVKAAEAFRR